MLDTIVILVPWGNYQIIDHNKFSPSTDGLTDFRFYPGTTFKNNPTSAEKKLHYYPRMTLYTTPYYAQTRLLKIECSIPKLINDGESINEYTQDDYAKAIDVLRTRLYERGVMIFTKHLLEAQVVGFHVGKNIPLSQGYTATLAIQELAKIDVSKRLDTNKADFRNEGHAYQFYTNSYALVFYDKFADIRKPKGRAIDKDTHNNQLSLFNKVKNTLISHKLLRIELRLSKKKKVNTVLSSLGFEKNPQLKDILSHDLSQKLLTQYWDTFYNDKNRFLLDMDTNPQSVLRRTLHHDPDISARKAIRATGFHLLAKDRGLRETRKIIEMYRPKNDWNSIKNDLEVYRSPPFPINTHGFIKDIEEELINFVPYKLKI